LVTSKLSFQPAVAADLARLNDPYPEQIEPTDAAAMAAIGVKLSRLAALENEILADFTEQPPYGIGWWHLVRARAAAFSSAASPIAVPLA
jgi:hypothetical protein